MVIPMVLLITLMMMVLIGVYISMTSTYVSKEYHRDLAEIRGYWAVYGAKELNLSNISYDYDGKYSIDVNRTASLYKWHWKLKPNSSGITNEDVYPRELGLADDNISILFYRKKP